MAAAVRLGNPSPDVVAVEARAAASRPAELAPVGLPVPGRARPGDLQQVLVLPTDPRPLPTVHQYDALLTLDASARPPMIMDGGR
jgi:hypothetical protein